VVTQLLTAKLLPETKPSTGTPAFAKGGFDVIIGNPPYVLQEIIFVKKKRILFRNMFPQKYQINTSTLIVH
jgi:hypothetical protein